jgi:hypothetical protein
VTFVLALRICELVYEQNPQMNVTHDESPTNPRKSAVHTTHMMKQYVPGNTLAKYNDTIRRAAGLAVDSEAVKRAMGLAVDSEAVKRAMGLAVDSEAMKRAVGLAVDSEAMKRAVGLSVDIEAMKRAVGLSVDIEAMKRAAGLGSISSIANHYTQHLNPISEHRDLLEKLRRQALGGLSAADFAHQLVAENPAFRAMEDAKKTLDRLLPTFRSIDLSQFEASEQDEQETKQIAESITRAATGQESLREAVEQIIHAIQAQQKPSVQLMLWLFFRKVLDWLIAGAIGAAMSHYAPAVLGESSQAAKKAVQELARSAVGSPELLLEYRYVSTKLLIVRQNPKARSPEVGRLSFGMAVMLLRKEKDFSLVLWTDKESGAEIQGWVFSRYLGKFI